MLGTPCCGRRVLFATVFSGSVLALGVAFVARAAAQPPRQPVVQQMSVADAAAVATYVQLGQPIFCGGGNGPYVAFTFDDGPGPLTPQLLAVLRQTGVPATFFLIGTHVVAMPGVVRQEAQLGVLGDHTWSHPPLPTLEAEPSMIETQLSHARFAISRRTGVRVSLFRAPFGQRDPTIDGIARGMGLLDVAWSVAVSDGSSPDVVYQQLVDHVQAGSIVLLHENEPGEIEAFARFLPVLKQRGLIPVTVPHLLALDPPNPTDLPNWSGQCHAHWTPPPTG